MRRLMLMLLLASAPLCAMQVPTGTGSEDYADDFEDEAQANITALKMQKQQLQADIAYIEKLKDKVYEAQDAEGESVSLDFWQGVILGNLDATCSLAAMQTRVRDFRRNFSHDVLKQCLYDEELCLVGRSLDVCLCDVTMRVDTWRMFLVVYLKVVNHALGEQPEIEEDADVEEGEFRDCKVPCIVVEPAAGRRRASSIDEINGLLDRMRRRSSATSSEGSPSTMEKKSSFSFPGRGTPSSLA